MPENRPADPAGAPSLPTLSSHCPTRAVLQPLCPRSAPPTRRHSARSTLAPSHPPRAALLAAAIADMELLASSEYFIGLFAASMSRQAYQLMYYKQQHHRPFVSLDMHWAQPDGTIN